MKACQRFRRPTKRRDELALTVALYLADDCNCTPSVTRYECIPESGGFIVRARLEHERGCALCRR